MTDAFRCTAYRCTLTIASCASRSVLARRPKGRITSATRGPAFLAPDCHACEVGEAHARGETPERWPDGSPVVRLTLEAPGYVRPKQVPTLRLTRAAGAGRPPRGYTSHGRTQTLAAWAVELEVGEQALRLRIAKHGAERALAMVKVGRVLVERAEAAE